MTDAAEQAVQTEETEVRPVEADAEAVEAEETEETTQAQAENQEENPAESSTEKEESQGIQKRFDELTKARREAERERDYWRQQAQREPEPAKVPEALKTLADFDYDEGKYASYMFQETTRAAVEAARRELEQASHHQSKNQKLGAFAEAEDRFAGEHKDYLDVTRNPNLAYTESMHEIVTDMDKGPEVMYYLGKNPDIADKIARMSITRQAMELGRIEERISQKPPKQVTSAPEPPPKIAAKGPTNTIKPDSSDSDKLSMDEWIKRRNKQLQR